MSKQNKASKLTFASIRRVGARLIALALLFVAVFIPNLAYSDEFEGVLHSSQSNNSVSIIVTPGWQSVLDKDPDWLTIGEMQKRIIDAASKAGGGVDDVRRYRVLPFVSMTVDKTAIESLRATAKKAQIWHDREHRATLTKSTSMVGASRLWRNGLTGKGQYVAVLDTGVDSRHPFLRGKIARQYEACFSHTECPNGKQEMVGPGAARASNSHGPDAHGTHVSGIIAGQNNKMSGIAPNAKIIAVNVFYWSRKAKGYVARDRDILSGIDHALYLKRKKGVKIAAINMSLGSGFYSSPCRRGSHYEIAAKEAISDGVLIVAASGNGKEFKPGQYKYGVGQPACIPGIISVGAIDKKSRVTPFSQGASFLDIVAPGGNILSSAISMKFGKPNYEAKTGTSMAAPHVSGAIAILRQAKPNATGTELMMAIKNSGRLVDDSYLRNVKTRVLDLDAMLRTIGYRIKSAVPKSAEPELKPAPKPTPALLPTQAPESGKKESGGWGAIK